MCAKGREGAGCLGPREIDGPTVPEQHVALRLPESGQLQRQRAILWRVRRFVFHTNKRGSRRLHRCTFHRQARLYHDGQGRGLDRKCNPVNIGKLYTDLPDFCASYASLFLLRTQGIIRHLWTSEICARLHAYLARAYWVPAYWRSTSWIQYFIRNSNRFLSIILFSVMM